MNRRRIDPSALADLIKASGVPFKQNGNSFYFTCPKCQKKDKLYINKREGFFKCFACSSDTGEEFKGSAEYALKFLITERSLEEIRAELYGEDLVVSEDPIDLSFHGYFDPTVESEFLEDEETDEGLQEIVWPLDFYPIDHKFSAKGLAYLESRGISLEMAKRYDIRYSPKNQRVIFPVAHKGRLFGHQDRAIFPTEYMMDDGTVRTAPKVLTMPGLKKDKTLMFADRLEGSPHAVLCEGPIDALKCDLVGGNVAAMGKLVSDAQLDLIRKAGIKKLYLALDPDANREIMQLTERASDMEIYLMKPAPGYKDFGEMDPEDVLQCFKDAAPINSSSLIIYLSGPMWN